jgi:anti-sigma B factor antagonist
VRTSERPQFSVEIEQRSDERALVAVYGEVDIYTAPQLHEALDSAIDAGARLLLVDLAEVAFIDSTGLGVLIGAAKRLHSADGALAIVCPHEKIRRIFQITGLDQVFAMHTSRDEALSTVPSD